MFKIKFFSFFCVFFIFCLDRLTKQIVLNLSNSFGELNIKINSFIEFNLIMNRGIAFGLFSYDEGYLYNIISLIIISIILILIYMTSKANKLEKFFLLLIIGGASGNLFDRLYYSSVIDFIDISYANFHWFIFNVADIFISIGVIMLIILEIINKKNIK